MPKDGVGLKPRFAKFMVLGARIDGERSCTLTIETGTHPVVRVRGYRARREYVVPLAMACEVLQARAVKLGPVGIVVTRDVRREED